MIDNRKLCALLHDLCNGTLDEQNAKLLDATLASDASAREQYAEWMTVEAALNRSCAELPTTSHAVGEYNAATTPPRTKARRLKLQRWTSAGMLAASLALVALASSFLTHTWIARGPVQEIASSMTLPGEGSLARVTSTLNCRWQQPSRGTGFGTELRAGDQLNLAAGLAEVTFNSGVRIILEGPATLDLSDATEAVLTDGRLAASIPNTAAQPRLRVSQCVAFEPGSEFGLLANSEGGGEVHVFSGRVSTTLLGELGETLETMRLSKSEGVRLAPSGRTMTKLTADDDRFVRSLAPTSGPHDGLYLHESFDYLNGPLAMHNGGFGWAGPWEDIEADFAPSKTATNGVARNSLEVEGMVSTGGRAVQTAQRNRIRRALSTSIGGVFDAAGLVENRDGHRLIGQNGRTIYLGFLQRVDKLDDVFYGFELHRGDGNGNRVLCIGNGADGAAYGVTSNYNQYGSENYLVLGEENDQPNLIVVRIDYGIDDRDVATVYRNPLSLADEDKCVRMGG